MKVVLAFVLLVAGINAGPHRQGVSLFNRDILANIDWNNERLVTGPIASAIEDLSQSIKDAGLDPLEIESYTNGYALPVPVLFNTETEILEFLFAGLSNIVINNLSYSIITNRLRFNIELPLIQASLRNAEMGVVVFDTVFKASAKGSIAIVKTKVEGVLRVSIGIITGISIRSLDIIFSLGSIESDLNVVIQNTDLSYFINNFLGVTIPNTLKDFSAEINELLEIIATEIIEANL